MSEPVSIAASTAVHVGVGDRASASFASAFGRICENVTAVIRGKPEVISCALLCLLCEGHLLIEDVPGVGKTSLAKALAASLDASFGRIQFTPDVLPTDVVGVNVWNEQDRVFEFRPGAVFSQVVLVDEINRASPKTQSALLEAMEERQVTTDGVSRSLERPFMVIATQNPIEHEGTYPLPESQLDRFFMRVRVGYPETDAAMQILTVHDGTAPPQVVPVASAAQVESMIASVAKIFVADAIRRYIVEIAERSRQHRSVSLGISPRGTLHLQRAAQARAAALDRAYVVPDDVKAMAEFVLGHRIRLSVDSQLAGVSAARALGEIIDSVAVPAGLR